MHFFVSSKLDPLSLVEQCFSPALFAHAEQDDFIDPSHSKKLYLSHSFFLGESVSDRVECV
jgi:hypothetical protein